MKTILVTSFAALFGLTMASSTPAAESRVDENVRLAFSAGLVSPRIPPSTTVRALSHSVRNVPVIVRATRSVDQKMLAQIRTAGAVTLRVDGKPLSYGAFVSVSVSRSSLARLLKFSWVKRVSLPPKAPLVLPLDRSAQLIRLQQARGSHPNRGRLTGEGMTIVDLDANVDAFHPQFFRGDGGYFDWIDVDGDGVFTPNVDAIDLDRNGGASSGEVGKPLLAQTLSTFYGKPLAARTPVFDPSIDWVFLDQNNNGERDYGLAAGFKEQTPAWGEPLFVPDDVNRNGKVDVGERFVRLKTSKFKAIYVHIEYYANIDHVYTRGVDLTAHRVDYTGGAYGYPDALHGSGVLSIVAGDLPLVGRRWVGVAPDADLVLGFEVAQVQSKSITWGLSQHPDVMLHETASWTGQPMDGSDSYSQMVDESVTKEHVTHTCPTGNLGGSRKHARVVLSASTTKSVPFHIPQDGTRYVELSLNLRGGTFSKLQLIEPNGDAHEVKGSSLTLSTGTPVYISHSTSDRGTDFFDMMMYADPKDSSSTPAKGDWSLQIDSDGASPVLDAYVSDSESGWGLGVAWPESIATDDSTAGIPSISDHCIAVGAHVGHPSSSAEPWYHGDEKAGELRGYSSRGPRIDGVQKPDLSAPDNPWVAAPAGKTLGNHVVPHGAVWPFGGTSAAGPHVTGAALLLAQVGVRGDGARDILRASCQVDSVTGVVPNTGYGWGRLDAASALGVAAAKGGPLVVTVDVQPQSVHVGEDVTLTVQVASNGQPAKGVLTRWDDGYDGHWDSDYQDITVRHVTADEQGRFPYKVRVLDTYGWAGAAVVWVTVLPPAPEPPFDGGISDASEDGTPQADAHEADVDSTDGASSSVGSPDVSGGGCGCRVGSTSTTRRGSSWALMVIGAVGLLLGRRRRR